ncbi:hypothetical protein ACPPVV_03095 [Rhodanobacter sp. Col0626]|uniref:hypothetical protein n=1 Tax=Rhodanobacter sp. Col0626 TaxID=3415679 RepID=UPI003CEBBFF5
MNAHATRLEAAQIWLDSNETGLVRPWLNASVLLPQLANGDGANAPAAAVVSGSFGRQAARDGDDALKGAGSDVGKIAEVLVRYPITGATTVLGLARKAVGYNPQLPATDGNADKFNAYVRKVMDAPFFHLDYSDNKALHQKTDNWDKLIGEIVELFEGVIDENRNRVTQGLKNLAHSATATSDKHQTMNVFCQQVVSVGATGVSVGIYSSEVSMVEHDGKHSSRQADYKVNRALLSFDTNSWPIFARMVAAKQITSVMEWLTDANTL